jgi:hypothetical protein
MITPIVTDTSQIALVPPPHPQALQMRLFAEKGDADCIVVTSADWAVLKQEINDHPLPGHRSDPLAKMDVHVCPDSDTARKMVAALQGDGIVCPVCEGEKQVEVPIKGKLILADCDQCKAKGKILSGRKPHYFSR